MLLVYVVRLYNKKEKSILLMPLEKENNLVSTPYIYMYIVYVYLTICIYDADVAIEENIMYNCIHLRKNI